MEPNRIAVKLYLDDPKGVSPQDVVPVFHDWIRRAAVPGLLIDVAGYAHVADGPGIILIGDGVDYALDLGEGRPGVLHTQKRGVEGPFAERLRRAVAGALAAAAELEREPSLGAGARVRSGEVLVRVLDRLVAPNEDATLDEVRDDLEALAGELFPGEQVTLTREGDPAAPFTVRIAAAVEPGAAALRSRLDGIAAPA